jgi:hypothetical protein
MPPAPVPVPTGSGNLFDPAVTGPARAGRKPVGYFDRTSRRSAFPRTPPASHGFHGHDDHE